MTQPNALLPSYSRIHSKLLGPKLNVTQLYNNLRATLKKEPSHIMPLRAYKEEKATPKGKPTLTKARVSSLLICYRPIVESFEIESRPLTRPKGRPHVHRNPIILQNKDPGSIQPSARNSFKMIRSSMDNILVSPWLDKQVPSRLFLKSIDTENPHKKARRVKRPIKAFRPRNMRWKLGRSQNVGKVIKGRCLKSLSPKTAGLVHNYRVNIG